MRRDDQAVELVVGVVGEREHHPVLAAFAGADFDAADDAVGAGRGGDLDAVGVAALMIEHRGEVDRRRVAADADGVEGARRRAAATIMRPSASGARHLIRRKVSSPLSTTVPGEANRPALRDK